MLPALVNEILRKFGSRISKQENRYGWQSPN